MLGIFNRRVKQSVAQTDPVQDELKRLVQEATNAQERGEYAKALELYRSGYNLALTLQNPQIVHVFLNSIGAIHVATDKYEEAEKAFEEALHIAKQLKQPVLVARTLNNLGELYAKQAQWEKAQNYHQEALELARPTGDALTIILALENLARDYIEQGNPQYAVHLLKEAVTVAEAKQDPYMGYGVLGRLGEASLAAGDVSVGRRLMAEAIQRSTGTPFERPRLIMRWLVKLADIELGEKQYQNALQLLQRAEDVAHRVGVQSAAFFMHTALKSAEVYLHLKNYTAAIAQAERAEVHARVLDDEVTLAKVAGYIGIALQGLEQPDAAVEKLSIALEAYENGVIDDLSEQTKVLLALGRSQQQLGKTEQALSTYKKVLELLDNTDNPLRRAEGLYLIASVHAENNERDEAINLFQEAERLYRENNELGQAAIIRCDIGNLRRAKGDFKAALNDFEEALVMLSNIDNPIIRGFVLSSVANIYTETGDIESAQSFYQESIKIAQEYHDRLAESLRLGNMAWMQVQIGKLDMAFINLEKAIAISRELNAMLPMAIQTNNLGWVYYLRHDYDQARRLIEQALVEVEVTESVQWRGVIKGNLAMVKLAQHDLDAAQTLIQEALADSRAAQDIENTVRNQIRQAMILLEGGELSTAKSLVEAAELAARKMFYRRGQAEAAQALAEIASKEGDQESAKRYFEEAARFYQMLHSPLANEMQKMANS
ncbi:MAG: hypothetical protein CUN55_02820 [Phototrophicales bacterium]|nr:MAG: hypothetical protein CUN55_02820 [Phototrophicales bacterium]